MFYYEQEMMNYQIEDESRQTSKMIDGKFLYAAMSEEFFQANNLPYERKESRIYPKGSFERVSDRALRITFDDKRSVKVTYTSDKWGHDQCNHTLEN